MISARVLSVLFSGSIVLAYSSASAGEVSVDQLRLVGVICSAGQSVELQGELDAAIFKMFGETKAKGDLDVNLLNQVFDHLESEKFQLDALRSIQDCAHRMVSTLAGTDAASAGETKGPGPLLMPAPLGHIQPGQHFAVAVGDTRLLAGTNMLLTMYNAIRNDSGEISRAHILLASEGDDRYYKLTQGSVRDISNTKCAIQLYNVDQKTELFSFRYICED